MDVAVVGSLTSGVQGNRKRNRKQTGRVNESERGGGWEGLILILIRGKIFETLPSDGLFKEQKPHPSPFPIQILLVFVVS